MKPRSKPGQRGKARYKVSLWNAAGKLVNVQTFETRLGMQSHVDECKKNWTLDTIRIENLAPATARARFMSYYREPDRASDRWSKVDY